MAKPGPKPTQINPVEFTKLCSYHLSLKCISDFYGVSEDTIQRYCKKQFKMGFAVYAHQKRAKYTGVLLSKFWQKVDAGNVACIIFGLKNICGWSDNMNVSEGKMGFGFTGV